jgi:hypothetical protein
MSGPRAAVYSPPALGLPFLAVIISDTDTMTASAFPDPVSAQAFIENVIDRSPGPVSPE